MNITSILRHWFTLLATLLTGWFVLPAEQQAELSKALGDLVAPLGIIATLLITAGWRLMLAWLGKVLRTGSGELENGGPSGGAGLLMMIGTMAVLGTALPSCSAPQLEAFKGIPIKGCVVTDQGTVCYSSKAGLSYEVDTRSGK